MISIDLLTRPFLNLLDTFGDGVLPIGNPADALRFSSSAIDSVHDVGRVGISTVSGGWQSTAATAAVDKAQQVQHSSVAVSDRGNDMATVVAEASEIVRTGMVELRGILQSFIDIAVAAGPTLATPPGQTMIIAAAIEHLGRALAVVGRVRAELSAETAKMTALTPAEHVPADAVPTSTSAAASTSPASAPTGAIDAITKTISAASSSGTQSISGLMDPMSATGGRSTGAPGSGADSLMGGKGSGRDGDTSRGDGVEVVLPDGSTAIAPNKEAAEAVRNALSQQGVPYVWGGTTPNEGLDCSGLTQWAYSESGVQIPRLAQEQDVGCPVDAGSLMPGDLAVWDGHVAMVIGNGQLVEAGDPVQVGPIRTTNSGMGFQGFYRPTE